MPIAVRQAHPPRILPAVLLAAVLGISVSGPLARLSHAPPLAIAAWRLGLSMGLISVVLIATGSWREYRSLARRDALIALGAGAVLALHFWSWITSITLTSVASSIVLVNLHPVVMVAGSAFFLREYPTRKQVVGIAVAMLGAFLVGYGDSGETAAASNALAGDLLALVGAVSVGAYYLVGRSLRQRLTLWPYVGLVYGACLVVVLLLAALTDVPLWPQPPRELWIFAGIALGPMMLGHTGFNWSLRHVPAFVVSLALLAEPVGATLLAAFLPSIAETPSAWTLAGGAVILGGLALGAIGGAKNPAPDATDPRR